MQFIEHAMTCSRRGLTNTLKLRIQPEPTASINDDKPSAKVGWM